MTQGTGFVSGAGTGAIGQSKENIILSELSSKKNFEWISEILDTFWHHYNNQITSYHKEKNQTCFQDKMILIELIIKL